jgi:hypothetical protein
VSAVTDRLSPENIATIARIIYRVRQRRAIEAAEREQQQRPSQDGRGGKQSKK